MPKSNGFTKDYAAFYGLDRDKVGISTVDKAKQIASTYKPGAIERRSSVGAINK